MQLENLILNLNSEIDKLKSALKECLESTKINKKDIEALQSAIKLLEETKADKDWIRRELDKVNLFLAIVAFYFMTNLRKYLLLNRKLIAESSRTSSIKRCLTKPALKCHTTSTMRCRRQSMS